MTYVSPQIGEGARQAKNVALPLMGLFAVWQTVGESYLEVTQSQDFDLQNFLDEQPQIFNIPSLATKLLSLPLVATTPLFYNIAHKELHKAWQDGEIATQGIYKHTQNPIYLADRLTALGFLMFSPTTEMSVATAGVFGLTHLAAMGESTYLENKLGNEYNKYKKQTPVFVGW